MIKSRKAKVVMGIRKKSLKTKKQLLQNEWGVLFNELSGDESLDAIERWRENEQERPRLWRFGLSQKSMWWRGMFIYCATFAESTSFFVWFILWREIDRECSILLGAPFVTGRSLVSILPSMQVLFCQFSLIRYIWSVFLYSGLKAGRCWVCLVWPIQKTATFVLTPARF